MKNSGDFDSKEVDEIVRQIRHRRAGGMQRCRITMQQLADNAREFPLIKAVFINKVCVILRAARNDYFKGPTI